MTHVHHLQANAFDLDQGWRAIDTCPRDGTSFEVKTQQGNVYRGFCRGSHVIVDDAREGEQPTHWRRG